MHRTFISGRAPLLVALGTAILLTGPGASQAQSGSPVTYLVSLNTTSLTDGTYAGPFTLDFQFVDGDNQITGVYDDNNTATITGLSGGTGFSSPSFTLTDGTPGVTASAEQVVSFTPGANLSFLATLTTDEDQYIADDFTFAILNNGQPFTTEDASGNGNGGFVSITEAMAPSSPDALTVASFDTQEQEFKPAVTPAPEPNGAATLMVGCLGSGLLVRRRLRPGGSVPARVALRH